MGKVLPALFLLLCIAATALGLRNVYGDPRLVEAMSAAVACGGKGPKCEARPFSVSRSAFFHEMVYQAAGQRVTVRCARVAMFLGDWNCTIR